MLTDIALAVYGGATGVALGALRDSGSIELTRVARTVKAADRVEVVFHRAFDCVRDQETSIQQLIDLGVRRVLSSGGGETALEGVDRLQSLQQRFGDKIEILPGGGGRAANAQEILNRSGCSQLHSAVSRRAGATSEGNIGVLQSSHLALDTNALGALRREVDRLDLSASV